MAGQPALPIEGERYVVRMPPSRRLSTSSAYLTSIDHIEFVVEDSAGRHKLDVFSPQQLNPPYGVQHAYGLSKVSASYKVEPQFECVFIGTPADFQGEPLNCTDWQAGQPDPPRYRKHQVGRPPAP